MIKSKLNTFGFWVTPVMISIIIGILAFIFIYDPIAKDRIIAIIWGSVVLLFTISQLFDTSKLISIDSNEKTITVYHYITRQSKIYNFKDIDGYVDMIEKPSRGRPFRVLFIVQNERFVQKISSFIYSNIDEMEIELKTTKYLGQKKYSYLKSIKVLLGRKVLND